MHILSKKKTWGIIANKSINADILNQWWQPPTFQWFQWVSSIWASARNPLHKWFFWSCWIQTTLGKPLALAAVRIWVPLPWLVEEAGGKPISLSCEYHLWSDVGEQVSSTNRNRDCWDDLQTLQHVMAAISISALGKATLGKELDFEEYCKVLQDFRYMYRDFYRSQSAGLKSLMKTSCHAFAKGKL